MGADEEEGAKRNASPASKESEMKSPEKKRDRRERPEMDVEFERRFESPVRRNAQSKERLPQKRATPDTREASNDGRTKKPLSESVMMADADAVFGAGEAPAEVTFSDRRSSFLSSAASSSSSSARPTPDSHAFERLGELRRRSHSSTPGLFGVTPNRQVCPPTPRRSQVSVRKSLLKSLTFSNSGLGKVDELKKLSEQQSDVLTPPSNRYPSSGKRSVMFSSRLSEEEKLLVFSSVTKKHKSKLGGDAGSEERQVRERVTRNKVRERGRHQLQHMITTSKPQVEAEAEGTPKRGVRINSPLRRRSYGGREVDHLDLENGPQSERKNRPGELRSEQEMEALIPYLEFVEPIGHGAFARVSVVQDHETKELYALKVNREKFIESNTCASFKQFHYSTLIWALLGENHHNIVPVYCAWSEPGWIYVQMELCQGGNLLQYVDRCMKDEKGDPTKRWEESQMWRCLGDAVSGLNHIHSKGFCHNDMKPGNLFIGGSDERGWRVMIGDFGNVKKRRALLEGDEGDFRYLSKEALDRGKSEPSSDIFSLGISFYEVVADVVLPEKGMWHDFRDGKIPELPQHLSKDLYTLLCSMMHPDPKARPKAHEIAEHPLIVTNRDTLLPHFGQYREQEFEVEDEGLVKTPDHGSCAFITTPLAESLMNDVDVGNRTMVRSNRNRALEESPSSTYDIDEPLGALEKQNHDSQEEMDDGVEFQASVSPRKCLLQYFDDMDCQ